MKFTRNESMVTLISIILLAHSISSTIRREQGFRKEIHAQHIKHISNGDDRKLNADEDDASIERLINEIEDLHLNIKNCIDSEFELPPSEIMAYSDILDKCVGEDYKIVLETYENILKEIKEITKERIKNSLEEGFCEDILFMCIEYFKTIELFIDLDFDITKSLQANRKELERKINPSKLDYLIQVSENKLDDYDDIRDKLIKQREFIVEYFEEKKDNYKRDHSGDIGGIGDRRD